MRLRPNPPRLITVVIAVALLVVGISGTLFPVPIVNELADVVLAPLGLELDRQLAYLCLFIAPSLLVVGSLLPGI